MPEINSPPQVPQPPLGNPAPSQTVQQAQNASVNLENKGFSSFGAIVLTIIAFIVSIVFFFGLALFVAFATNPFDSTKPPNSLISFVYGLAMVSIFAGPPIVAIIVAFVTTRPKTDRPIKLNKLFLILSISVLVMLILFL